MKKTVLISILFVLGSCSEKIEPKINPSIKPSEIKISSSPKTEPTITPSIVASIIPSTSIIPSPQKSSNSDLCCTTGDKMWTTVYGRVTDVKGGILSDYSVKIEILDDIPNKKIYQSNEMSYDNNSKPMFVIRAVLIEPKDKVLANLTIEKNNIVLYKSQITIFNGLNDNLNYFDIKLTE